jgi:alpha-beta hydrolase superfamily lysophospholipase
MMETFYFGDENELFGAYWEPEVAHPSNPQVLIINALGHEYMRSHSLLQRLSYELARAGFHVLRFDYFGTGDSEGIDLNCTLKRCLIDATKAQVELAAKAGMGPNLVIGIRVGANLALRMTSAGTVAGVVVWDPIVQGDIHIKRQIQIDIRMRKDRDHFLRPRPKQGGNNEELLGITYDPATISEIAAIRLGEDLAHLGSTPMGFVSSAGQAESSLGVMAEQQVEPIFHLQCPDLPWDNLHLDHGPLIPSTKIADVANAARDMLK